LTPKKTGTLMAWMTTALTFAMSVQMESFNNFTFRLGCSPRNWTCFGNQALEKQQFRHVAFLSVIRDHLNYLKLLFSDRRQREFNVSPDDIDAIRQLYTHCT
jgi:hypothetical protein